MKSPITTHVLDTSSGRPAKGIDAELDFFESGNWKPVGKGQTDADGRITNILPEGFVLTKGIFRLTFKTEPYFPAKGFYPHIPIIFEVFDTGSHYHVPLLLSPFGYSTYRGS